MIMFHNKYSSVDVLLLARSGRVMYGVTGISRI